MENDSKTKFALKYKEVLKYKAEVSKKIEQTF